MLRRLFILISLAGIAPVATAAEWKIDPTLRFKAGYDDNVRLATDDEVSSAVGTVSASSIFSVATPTSGASGEVRFDFRRFEADSDLDDNNSRLNLRTYHTLERSRLGLDLDFVQDTTLDSQLEATGLVFDRITRQTAAVSPNWTWSFDERTQLGASYAYRAIEYKNAGGTGLVDSSLNSAQLSLTRVLNEKTTASITLSGTRSDNDNDVSSTNINLQGGASYRFSETLSASLFAGVRRTETDRSAGSSIFIRSGNTIIDVIPQTVSVSSSDRGSTFSASITRTFLRGETGLSASRDISNDINGIPFEVNQIRWTNLYRFGETLSGNLAVTLSNSQTNNTAGQSLDRNYYQIIPGFSWQFKQFWALSGSYSYRKQTFDDTGDDAVGNAANLTLTYQWPRIAVSR